MKMPFTDKLGHALEYGILAVLLYRAFRLGTPEKLARHAFVLAWITAVAYGVTDEWHQSFVPPRVPAASDLLADTVGSLCGLLGWSQRTFV
jgi:VanZ family protein